ncbi:MAG TPA: rRNA maturation RNase YbeY [Nitrospira sp.]|nr:rRNA maturation RNase YbeY [Nitrospira sp.]
MPVLFQTHVRAVQFHETRLRRLAQTVLRDVGESSAELGLSFVGERRMRRLNRRFRHKDRTTDVLAFATREARLPHSSRLQAGLLGDVVISIPTAMRQARDGQRSLDQEIVVLLVHGILHLCGYDHERSEAEARRMQRREQTVLTRLGRIPRIARPARGR